MPAPDRCRLVAVGLAVAVVLSACGGGDPARDDAHGRFVALDGSPRVPDDAGVVTDIDADFATLTLDGDKVYEIHDEVQSFASLDGSTLPLRARLGQYVHVGLDGGTVLWVAAIGSVLRLPREPHTVVYLSSVVRVDRGERRVVLRDGTVFDVAPSVELGPDGLAGRALPVAAVLRVDVTTDAVVDIEPAS